MMRHLSASFEVETFGVETFGVKTVGNVPVSHELEKCVPS